MRLNPPRARGGGAKRQRGRTAQSLSHTQAKTKYKDPPRFPSTHFGGGLSPSLAGEVAQREPACPRRSLPGEGSLCETQSHVRYLAPYQILLARGEVSQTALPFGTEGSHCETRSHVRYLATYQILPASATCPGCFQRGRTHHLSSITTIVDDKFHLNFHSRR